MRGSCAAAAAWCVLRAAAAPAERPKRDAARPNIVFFLTDDQDIVLGGALPAHDGATPLPRTAELMLSQGAHAENFFIHTPICCPSRSETLTGRYLHNVKQPVSEKQCGAAYTGHDDAGNACCMHVDEVLVNNFTMARYLKEQGGYRVGMFGKYLNVCPLEPQRGFDAWYANDGSSYFSPWFNVKNIRGLADGHLQYGKEDYSTALIGNYSLAWIREVAQTGDPWFAYIGTKACHDPFQPAHWYSETWEDAWPAGAPRPPSWNVTSEQRARHHPTVAKMGMITAQSAQCIDDDFKNRWRTLLSVDDLIAATFALTDELGVTNSTYFMYTSDHGYQLGELNLNWDKRNVYDTNVRIHMLIRGPGIAPGSSFDFLASNVDISPTLLAMAGLDAPDGVDGRSFLPLIASAESGPPLPPRTQQHLLEQPRRGAVRSTWRDAHFIEYYYVGLGGYCGMKEQIEEPDNNFIAVRHVGGAFGNTLYAEFQDGSDGNVAFDKPQHYELFDLDKDPWQLDNVYESANASHRAELHRQVQAWLHCKGASCP